ncbi:MAG TPA: gamma carbonic anhydrase family protein [Spirochaetota bacterium]|nr:gamma carbonic anhydrase family protein [Spirochaetota bacterium]HPJ36278.1 gamma carbonic anhydrase family protein [Spirochaetota bacterium]
MPIYEVNKRRPVIGQGSWIAPTAQIIGDVRIGDNCYIGYGAVIRGDYGTVVIGNGSSVEEMVMIHARPGGLTDIGESVTIGHMAMLHNCTLKDFCVVGMNSTITDFSEVGEWAIIAEHTLVKRNQVIPPRKIYAGAPAAEKGDVQQKHMDEWGAAKKVYVGMCKLNLDTLKDITEDYA